MSQARAIVKIPFFVCSWQVATRFNSEKVAYSSNLSNVPRNRWRTNSFSQTKHHLWGRLKVLEPRSRHSLMKLLEIWKITLIIKDPVTCLSLALSSAVNTLAAIRILSKMVLDRTSGFWSSWPGSPPWPELRFSNSGSWRWPKYGGTIGRRL